MLVAMGLKQLAPPWVTKLPQPQSGEANHEMKPSDHCVKVNLSYLQVGLTSSLLLQLVKANMQSDPKSCYLQACDLGQVM